MMQDPANTWFRWQVIGRPGPRLTQALPFGEAVRAAVMRAGNRINLTHLPDSLHGIPGDPRHGHAHWLSEDADGDGLIDHVTLYASSGIPSSVLPALRGVGPVWIDQTWTLTPQEVTLADTVRLAGPARCWQAATAYVTPFWRLDRHGKDRPALNPRAQLLREIAQRCLPPPTSLAWSPSISRKEINPNSFVQRTRMRQPPADAWLGAPALTFQDAVTGPLAFGFGAHFGLGLLRPGD